MKFWTGTMNVIHIIISINGSKTEPWGTLAIKDNVHDFVPSLFANWVLFVSWLSNQASFILLIPQWSSLFNNVVLFNASKSWPMMPTICKDASSDEHK